MKIMYSFRRPKNEKALSSTKKTEPYGFIVKPFREKDLLVTLEIAKYRHENSMESSYKKKEDLQLQLEKIFSENTDVSIGATCITSSKTFNKRWLLPIIFSKEFFSRGCNYSDIKKVLLPVPWKKELENLNRLMKAQFS